MKKYLAMSLSIGIVAGLWFFTASKLNLMPWPAYIGWSVFFWEGANFEAVKRGFPAIVLGAVLGFITFYCIGLLPDLNTVNLIFASLMVCLLAFTMAFAQNIKIFQVASATFIGASHYFALRGHAVYLDDPLMAFLTAAFVTSIGLILGVISVWLGGVINKTVVKYEDY
ncbi:MAG: DUF1097 domain-containing protein [Eubacteriales bacterium]|nr:DUF1097 domain-containing protein [Eubacteriales bacterium]